MKYFSMFSGIGGFELGINRAYNNKLQSQKTKEGVQDQRGDEDIDEQKDSVLSSNNSPLCVGYSEIDKYADQIYQKHFRGHKNYGNAKTINPEELPGFDLLVGGFPCQAFSIAGKRQGFEDTRGTLFFDIARIARVKRPKMLLLENVKGLLNHNRGSTFAKILEALWELGYDVEWCVLNSKNFGVPQNRERVFIIGHLGGRSGRKIFPIRENGAEIKKINEKGLECIYDGNFQSKRVYGINGLSPTVPTACGGQHIPFIAGTLTGGGHSGGMHSDMTGIKELNGRIRRLTPTECERLQGFPDGWTEGVSDTQRYKCLGNAVTVNVIEAIMERLI